MDKPTKIVMSDWRVVVYPRNPGDFGFARISGQDQSEDEWRRDCESIANQIERHVDGLPSAGCKTAVEYDSKEICTFCGYTWEEEEDGLPLCCEKAQDWFNAQAGPRKGEA